MSQKQQQQSVKAMPSATGERPLTWRVLLSFYLPLVLTSQMMTLSIPFINLALSRATDPQLHLAAFGVCFGLTVFLNAPMLVTRDAGAGLCEDRLRWHRLMRLTLWTGGVITFLDLLLAFTPLGDWAFGHLLEATPRVVEEAKRVAFALAPLPVLVGLRGLYSALAMRAQKTRLLTLATLGRLAVLGTVLWLIHRAGAPTAGAVGWSLTLGIGVETVCIAWVTRHLLAALPARTEAGQVFTVRRMISFALPLVVSALAWTAMRPLINAVLGRTADSEAAQASFGVLHPLILLTGSALWSLQATHQILATDRARARKALGFGLTMTAIFASVVLTIGWLPPVRVWLLTGVFTLPPNLLAYVQPAMHWLFLAPLLLGIRACFKGMILASKRTGVISLTASLDLLFVSVIGFGTLVIWPSVNGALLGVLLVAAAELVESSVLGTTLWRRAPERVAMRGIRR